MVASYRTVFGDIHNHNAHGYGVGSIERSVDIARGHLDFFAFTGHSSWHDLGRLEGDAQRHFTAGFRRLRETWPRVQEVIADANRDDAFCAFLGFEWHSNLFGDQCVVFPDDHQPLHYTPRVEELRAFCRAKSALMIPHHLAYPRGRRGANWDVFDPECTPVVEVYSWHGNSETDRGPYPMITGSPGGRDTYNTVDAALKRGHRFGFVASSDNHSGFPGAYGEGLMAALVEDLTRPAILDAIRARRTYALTGDRIGIELAVDGAPMGATLAHRRSVEVDYAVQGRDAIDVVETVVNGRVVDRAWGADEGEEAATAGPFQVRLEWGWGPWASLGLARITDWAFDLAIDGGRLRRHFPCLASGPFDEARRHRFATHGDTGLAVRSYTSRQGAFRGNPNQSVVLEIDGDAATRLRLDLSAPVAGRIEVTAGELRAGSRPWHVGPYPAESLLWHRLLRGSATAVRRRLDVEVPAGGGWVYLRVRQQNGEMAWTSPVFIDARQDD